MTLIEIPRGKPAQILRRFDGNDLCDAIERAVAASLAVSVEDMQTLSRGRARVAFARQIAMYLAHVVMSLNYSEIGRIFRRDRTTAAYACRVIEDLRDNPSTDALLEALETALGACGEIRGWRQ